MRVSRRGNPRRAAPLAALVGLALLAPAARGGSGGVACHCFRERAFDPARPAAADPYILATTENSLLAAAFDLDKSALVRTKMTGTAGGDLWVAQFTASTSGVPAAALLAARNRADRWADAFAALDLGPPRLPPPLADAVQRGGDDASLAAAAADAVLRLRLGVEPAPARALGAGDGETIAACLLAALSGRSVAELYQTAVAGSQSWGQLFDAAGVAPEQIEAAVRRQLR